MKDFNPETIALPPELAGRQWLTFEEFGSLIGLKAPTIRGWGRRGIVKIKKFTPHCRRIHISELERLKNGELMENVDKISHN